MRSFTHFFYRGCSVFTFINIDSNDKIKKTFIFFATLFCIFLFPSVIFFYLYQHYHQILISICNLSMQQWPKLLQLCNKFDTTGTSQQSCEKIVGFVVIVQVIFSFFQWIKLLILMMANLCQMNFPTLDQNWCQIWIKHHPFPKDYLIV